MKLVFTISDSVIAFHVGWNVEYRSAILEIPDASLPQIVRDWRHQRDKDKKAGKPFYDTISISILDEEMP